jgi:hypothetical protein
MSYRRIHKHGTYSWVVCNGSRRVEEKRVLEWTVEARVVSVTRACGVGVDDKLEGGREEGLKLPVLKLRMSDAVGSLGVTEIVEAESGPSWCRGVCCLSTAWSAVMDWDGTGR